MSGKGTLREPGGQDPDNGNGETGRVPNSRGWRRSPGFPRRGT